jgi:hypothetical protein
MTVTRITWLLALLALAPAANAQLYKCVGKDGNVTYQAEPCPQSAKEDRLRAPSAPSAPAASEAKPAEKKADAKAEASDAEVYANASKKCVDDILAAARPSWESSLKNSRVTGEFPEEEFRRSGTELCECLTNRARTEMPASEMRAKANALMSRYMREAMQGGDCKPPPESIVGQRLQDVR